MSLFPLKPTIYMTHMRIREEAAANREKHENKEVMRRLKGETPPESPPVATPLPSTSPSPPPVMKRE
jgi:hypothetical protein